jgi:TetR/AcrR family transcriptional regulator of autoinduction and epiphytic fitness
MSEEERRTYLIDAAERVFLEQGFHTATMQDIAQQAGMSKKTLYQIFASKTALFDALLNDRFSVFTVTIEDDVRPPRAVLTDVLRRSVAHALTERQVAIVRLMVAESPRSSEIGAALDRLGAGPRKGALGQWLAAKTAEGALNVADPYETASLLFWTAAGDFLMESLLHNTHTTTMAAIEARVERVVAGFFREMAG